MRHSLGTRIAGLGLLVGCSQMAPVPGRGITGVSRWSTVELRVGYPGAWTTRMTTAGTDRYAWIYQTAGEPYAFLFDGTTVRAFVGPAEVAEDSSPSAPLRSHATLSALMFPIIPTTAVPASHQRSLGPDGLPRTITGPLDFPGTPTQQVTIELSDYRLVEGHPVPFRLRYSTQDQEIADEQVRSYCLHDNPMPASDFESPTTLPPCSANP